MYAESFGIQGASEAVENAARWVQWAQAGIMAGASDNEATIRYNLDQFWKAKQAAYSSEDATGRSQLERLDTYAQGTWQALEAGKIFSSSPSYWEYWKRAMLPFYNTLAGQAPRPDAMQAATNAASAAAAQEAAANRAGGNFGANMAALARRNAAAIHGEVAGAADLWHQTSPEPMGIPLWAWIAGAVALGAVLLMQRR